MFENLIVDVKAKIDEITYEKISFELTPNQSAVFNLQINSQIQLFIELRFDTGSHSDEDVLFAVFENKKCLANGIGTLEDVFADIKDLLPNYFL